MKAPDNVYVRLENIGSSWDVSTLDNGGEKYIRKEALLEKIDKILNAKPDGGLAVDIAAQAFIDIKKVINSM